MAEYTEERIFITPGHVMASGKPWMNIWRKRHDGYWDVFSVEDGKEIKING